jgi:hypothetical protein
MKTKLLLASLLFGVVTISKAQVTIYSNDFTAATGLSIIDGDGDTANWGLYTGNATSQGWGLTGNFAGSRSWNPATATPAGPLTPNNFLITPEVAIPDTFGTTTLSFKLGSNDSSFPAEQISIYLAPATATTAAAIAALTPVFNYTLDASDALTADTRSVDVTAYNGQSVRIVMRHHGCTDQDLLYFDDLLLSQESLGTETFAASRFVVSPNPTSGIFNINSKDHLDIKTVSLTDMNGRVVKQTSFEAITNVQMNISDLATGVYMMKISSTEGSVTKKIIKN